MNDPLQPRQFEQLSMFMSGREISGLQAGMGDKMYEGEPTSVVMRNKKAEAEYEGLAPKVRAEGVQQPIEISQELGDEGRKQILDGHHRASVAMEDPDRLVPVLHHKDENDLMNRDYWKAYPNL